MENINKQFNADQALDQFQEIMTKLSKTEKLSHTLNTLEASKNHIISIYNQGKINGFAEGEKVGYNKGFIDGSKIKIEL